MPESIYTVILIFLITFIILFYGYRINDFNIEGIIFGVRVPIKYRENDKVKSVAKKYKKKLTLLTLVFGIIFLGIYAIVLKSYIILIYIYSLIFINFYCCYSANKELKEVKKDIGWAADSTNKVYIEIGNKYKEKNRFNLFYISGVISIIGIIITAFRLPILPKMVPIHFGLNGIDGWADSTSLNGKIQIITLPIIGLIVVLSLLYSAKIKSDKENTNFNGGMLRSLKAKKLYSSEIYNKMLGMHAVGISLIIFYLNLIILGIVKFTKEKNYIFMIITILVIILPTIYYFYKMKNAHENYNENESNEEEIYRDDDKYYILGMMYFNPSDPSNVVPKRIGCGLSFNYANILGRIILLISIGILITPLVILIVLNI